MTDVKQSHSPDLVMISLSVTTCYILWHFHTFGRDITLFLKVTLRPTILNINIPCPSRNTDMFWVYFRGFIVKKNRKQIKYETFIVMKSSKNIKEIIIKHHNFFSWEVQNIEFCHHSSCDITSQLLWLSLAGLPKIVTRLQQEVTLTSNMTAVSLSW